jgi:hypothetical protein
MCLIFQFSLACSPAPPPTSATAPTPRPGRTPTRRAPLRGHRIRSPVRFQRSQALSPRQDHSGASREARQAPCYHFAIARMAFAGRFEGGTQLSHPDPHPRLGGRSPPPTLGWNSPARAPRPARGYPRERPGSRRGWAARVVAGAAAPRLAGRRRLKKEERPGRAVPCGSKMTARKAQTASRAAVDVRRSIARKLLGGSCQSRSTTSLTSHRRTCPASRTTPERAVCGPTPASDAVSGRHVGSEP